MKARIYESPLRVEIVSSDKPLVILIFPFIVNYKLGNFDRAFEVPAGYPHADLRQTSQILR